MMLLSEFEVPHVVVLEALRRGELEHPAASELVTTEGPEAKVSDAAQGELRRKLKDIRANTWSPVIAALDRLALTVAQPQTVVAGRRVNALTPFARDMLDDLHASVERRASAGRLR